MELGDVELGDVELGGVELGDVELGDTLEEEPENGVEGSDPLLNSSLPDDSSLLDDLRLLTSLDDLVLDCSLDRPLLLN